MRSTLISPILFHSFLHNSPLIHFFFSFTPIFKVRYIKITWNNKYTKDILPSISKPESNSPPLFLILSLKEIHGFCFSSPPLRPQSPRQEAPASHFPLASRLPPTTFLSRSRNRQFHSRPSSPRLQTPFKSSQKPSHFRDHHRVGESPL